MHEVTPSRSLVAILLVSFLLSSCNTQVVDVPFPYADSAYVQPVTYPLKLSDPKKIDWRIIRTGAVKPSTKNLDLASISSTAYDPSGFQPFSQTPVTSRVDFSKLPDTVFNFDKIPSRSLQFKVYVASPPTIVKAGAYTPKTNATLSVSDWSPALGLQGHNILCLLEDRSGLLWIGTDKGLYRFDGEFILSYNMPGATCLAQDRDGVIWFLGPQGIARLNEHAGIISFSPLITTPFPRLPKLIIDDRGQIWITQTGDKGVDVVDPATSTFKHIDRTNGISGTNRLGAFEDNKKNIWLSTNDGVSIINAARNKVSFLRKSNGLFSDTLRAINADKKGKVWLSFKDGGLSSADMDAGMVTNFGPVFDYQNEITYRLIADNDNRVWMATNHGLAMIDQIKNQVYYFKDESGVLRDLTLDVLFDKKQRVWVGTFQSGLIRIEQDARIVNPIGKTSIASTYADEDGKIWIGSSNEGVIILDEAGKRTLQLNKQMGFKDNTIQSISHVGNEIWITSDGGLDQIDQKNRIVQHTGKKEGLNSDTLYNVIRDNKNNVWFTGPTEGIEFMDSARTAIRSATTSNGLNDNTISNLKEDQQGHVWVATLRGGVDIINTTDWTVRYLNDLPGLHDTCYRVLMLDKYGRMWIGTDKGLYIADMKKAIVTSIGEPQGLTNAYVTSIIEYKDQVIVGTHDKANIITPPPYDADSSGKWVVSILANSEGLSLGQTSWDVNAITKDGRYIWGDLGITVIHEIKPQKDTSETFIAGINIMNQFRDFANPISLNDHDTLWTRDSFYLKDQTPLNVGKAAYPGFHWDSVSGPFNIPENLTIPYDQNFIQFQFTEANIGRTDKPKYAYILLGIDKKWSGFSEKSYTDNYLNLPPGNYIFKVRSKNISGAWSAPASFSFTILPPWWKTWWAYTIYILAIVGIIWGFIHYRSKQLLRENKLLEDKVTARTLEVKQQAEELSTVNQISQALVSQADLHDLIKLVGDQLRDLFKANIVYIALLDKKTKIINFPYQYGDLLPPLKLGEGLTSKIILTGEPLLINKDVTEKTSSLGIDRVGLPAASYLGVPIPVSDEIIGVLSIQSTEMENRFAEKDKRLLGTIAANVGVAIRKARLFEEVKLANTDADLARKNAEEANAAKSAFLSTVSHELRTPLTSVLGFAKITKKRLEEKIFPITDKSDPKTIKTIEQISGNLNVVISEGERLTNLINDVLDLAKIEAGKMEWNMEPVRITDVVERAIAATSSLFDQKNLKLERNIQPDLPDVLGDRDKLIQVVVNLLSNAVKFTNQGAVTCSVALKDGNIVAGITDTGIGIAVQDHDKVFEQFKQVGDTLTDKPKGTGLGLPICKEIVEHHNGRIWLDSDLGQGSTFYFSLPVAVSDEKAVRHIHLNDLVRQLKKRMEHSHPTKHVSNATILVVDDDDGIRSLLKQELGEAGYNIEEAANGKEAIAKIRTVRPDLVILDVMMPEMNGFDVAAILKNDPQTMEIPIIILSVVQDKSRGFRIGVDRYLTKPIDTTLLFSEIGDLLEQGKSRKKVMVVDEDNVTIRTLTDVLEAKGYQVVESDGHELVEKAIATQPDIIILNSLISDKQEIVRTLRFEKGLENVLFLIYQ